MTETRTGCLCEKLDWSGVDMDNDLGEEGMDHHPQCPLPSRGAMIDVIDSSGKHWYWSTHCRHDDHGPCAATTINDGPRRPAQCKVCAAPCVCPCHRGAAPVH